MVITLIPILNFIGHYSIQLVYLLVFNSMYYFISLTVTREGGIRITDRDTTARVIVLLVCLGKDLLNIIQLTRCAVVLGLDI